MIRSEFAANVALSQGSQAPAAWMRPAPVRAPRKAPGLLSRLVALFA